MSFILVNLTGGRKPAHGKRNSVPDDIPIRLAVTFAPSRARVLQGINIQVLKCLVKQQMEQ